MQKAIFREQLTNYFNEFASILATTDGEWVVKGLIDVYRNIYSLSIDTKIVSKIIELMLFPTLARFAASHQYQMLLSNHQNHYPDITFISPDNSQIALDLKSTYRLDDHTVNGFTLGAFTGYFRQRKSTKNITYPYEAYHGHFVLGVIYSRQDEDNDERRIYTLEDLSQINSVAKNFHIILQEKWQIASDRPGSGNTKNIGSIRNIGDLTKGEGSFTAYGESIFDDYWMNYLTEDMARAIDSIVPYHNLREYWIWRNVR